ncbi:hypothetical protein ACFLZ7_01165 [Nanoarchaeota archaeon]
MAKAYSLLKQEEELVRRKYQLMKVILKEKNPKRKQKAHSLVLQIIKRQQGIEKQEIEKDPKLKNIAPKREKLLTQQKNLIQSNQIKNTEDKIKEELHLIENLEDYEKKKEKGKAPEKVPGKGLRFPKPVLVGIAVFLIIVLFFAFKPGDLMAGVLGEDIVKAKFNALERTYIAAGKMPHTQAYVSTLAEALSAKTGRAITAAMLLDDDNENFEFTGIKIDESDDFNPTATLYFKTTSGKETEVGPVSAEDEGAFYIRDEIESMKENIGEGLSVAKKSNAVSNKKGKLIDALDRQAKGQLVMRPSLETQMKFASEQEMRQVLESITKITIEYDPASAWDVGTGEDFKITYYLKDGKTLVKYVDEFPLSVLV